MLWLEKQLSGTPLLLTSRLLCASARRPNSVHACTQFDKENFLPRGIVDDSPAGFALSVGIIPAGSVVVQLSDSGQFARQISISYNLDFYRAARAIAAQASNNYKFTLNKVRLMSNNSLTALCASSSFRFCMPHMHGSWATVDPGLQLLRLCRRHSAT